MKSGLQLIEALAPIITGYPKGSKCSRDRAAWLHAQASEILGRTALISDFTEIGPERFREHLIARGFASSTISQRMTLYFSAWRQLYGKYPQAVPKPPVSAKEEAARQREAAKRGKGSREAATLEPIDVKLRARDLELFMKGVYVPRRLLGKSPETTRRYLGVISALRRHLGRRPTLDDLNDSTICEFLQCRLASSVSPHTVAGDRRTIAALANYAARKKLIPEFLEVPKTPEPELRPEAWTLDELRQLLDACRELTGVICGRPASLWWTALHLLAIDTGERATAILSLRWEWLDRKTGYFKIPATVRKGKVKPLTGKLQSSLDAVNQLWETGREFVFMEPGAMHFTSFYRRYKSVLRKAGLPAGRTHMLQRLRRTFASLIERVGGDATRALLHTSRRVTERSYLDERLIERTQTSSFIAQAVGRTLDRLSEVEAIDEAEMLPVAAMVKGVAG